MDDKKNIAKAAGSMSFATLISRVLGYVKDMILAGYFGATGIADTFFVSFRIPNLLRELFAEGSMSAAFIPVLTEYHAKSGGEEARRLVRVIFTFVLLFVGAVCIAGIVFAPGIVGLIAPGFLNMPDKFSLAVLLTRIMFPFLLFISLAAVVMGALNTSRVFFIPALAPAMLNVTIILTVIILVPAMKVPVTGVAIGVAIGGFVQLAFQLPSFLKNRYSLSPEFDFRHPGLKKISALILPATMGLAVAQINIFVSTILASYLMEGSITYLYYSMRLIQFPAGIFGVAMGMAVLPTLSGHAVKGDFEKLREDFSFALRLLFFITVPAMAGLIALREPIVNVLFQRGRFDYAATAGTAEALFFYSLGIWAIVGVRVVTASFYSMQDTRTPVKAAVMAMLTNLLMSVILMGYLKHSGLALANSIASGVNFLLLFYFLRRKLKRIDARRVIRSFMKTLMASVVMGITGWMMLHVLLNPGLWQEGGRSLVKAGYLSVTILVSMGLYFLVSYILRNEELGYIVSLAKKNFN